MFQILINGEGESLTFQLFFLVMFVAFILAHLYVYCYVGEMLLVQVRYTIISIPERQQIARSIIPIEIVWNFAAKRDACHRI